MKRTDASNDTTLAVDDELEKLKGDHEATMLAKEIVETGRSQAVDHAEQRSVPHSASTASRADRILCSRLEKLLAEIALLEAKQAGMVSLAFQERKHERADVCATDR